jgi:hypothetical protein
MRCAILALLFPLISHGAELEYNLLTSHFFDSCDVAVSFENKIGDCGKVISNPILGIKSGGLRGFVGQNSVGSPLLGTTYTKEFLVVGAYLQDTVAFKRRNIAPVGFELSPSVILTPIMGFEFEAKIEKTKVFTIITPILLTVGLGYDF